MTDQPVQNTTRSKKWLPLIIVAIVLIVPLMQWIGSASKSGCSRDDVLAIVKQKVQEQLESNLNKAALFGLGAGILLRWFNSDTKIDGVPQGSFKLDAIRAVNRSDTRTACALNVNSTYDIENKTGNKTDYNTTMTEITYTHEQTED